MEESGRIALISNNSSEEEKTTTNKSVVDTNISILVVDDDTTCLAIVAAILKKFKYQVVTVKHPKDALCTLRIKGGAFDLVVSDVHMPDMNGFELQQVIAQEFDLPVVLMSADEKESIAVKGLESGAAFFILKPVSPDDVRDLWQFAAMKKKSQLVIHDDEEKKTSADKNNDSCNNEIIAANDAAANVAAAVITGSSSVNELDTANNKKESKRKSPQKAADQQKGETSQSCSQKKPKVVWTNSLHNRFLEAIRSIGLDRAVPKKILEVMNVPGLTRENVASHLQKYRIFLRRVSDASCKIQYTPDHKGLRGSIFRSSLESSSSAGTTTNPPTLNFSKFPYRNPRLQFLHNNNTSYNINISPLRQNLETLPISSTVQSGFGQSRLLSNNNETGPTFKPNILMSGYQSSISDRTYLMRHNYLSNNISLQDLTITNNNTPVYDIIGTSSNNNVSSMQTSNYVGYSLANLKHRLSLPNSWRAPINNNNNIISLDGDDRLVQTDQNVGFVERNDSGGGQLLSDVVADYYGRGQMMMPNSYNLLPNLVSGDVENNIGGVMNDHQSSALSPMFDLSEFHDIFSIAQLQTPLGEGDHHFEQTSIQNQQNGGEIITNSAMYGGGTTSQWDHAVASFDQAPNQHSGQGLSNSQEFGTFSQLSEQVPLATNQQQFGEGLTNSLGFNASSQSKTHISPTERDDEEFLESLLAPFAEDQTLDGI